ncbi:MAG: hypothetical protein RIM23_28465 [Coleofasciculus sp. G3-WIS-01]|uniref:hypothetical protein n=1 Tax=Coleofasciculus sp. G3-WIS-01 TaxID=3069528 RepID=UPI0033033E88
MHPISSTKSRSRSHPFNPITTRSQFFPSTSPKRDNEAQIAFSRLHDGLSREGMLAI